jgi:hypothetical protein
MSGKAIRGQQMQIDLSNFHYYDNLTRSLKQTGRIISGSDPPHLRQRAGYADHWPGQQARDGHD